MKKNKMELVLVAIIVVFLFFCVFFVFGAVAEQDKATITATLTARGLTMVEAERHTFIDGYGPFYLADKNTRIYRVVERDKDGRESVEWVRFGLFGTDWAKDGE